MHVKESYTTYTNVVYISAITKYGSTSFTPVNVKQTEAESAFSILNTVALSSVGDWAGNAYSATKLQTARTIRVNLASTSAASFDGTANITPGVTGTLPTGNGGTGVTSHTANRLVWSTSATAIQAGYHYAATDRVAINYTSAPSENFYVSGTSRFTNTIKLNQEDNVALNFRPGLDGYSTTASHFTSGNEALVFATKNAVTSFIFINGEDSITNHAADRWTKITPALQIKKNSVYIGSLIGEGVTPAYKFYVNGTTYLNGATIINGATTVSSTITAAGMIRCNGAPIFSYRYSQSNNAPAFIFDKAGSNYTGIGANGSSDTIYFGAVGTDGNWNWVTSYKQKWVFNGSVTADSFNGPSTSANYLNINNSANCADGLQYIQTSAQTAGGDLPTATWWHVIKMNHGTGDTYYKRLLAFNFWTGNDIRTGNADGDGKVDAWYKVWCQGNSVTGAVWNDYAECRESDTQEAGYVLAETGKDNLVKTTERLQHFAGVSSDTWGFSQGETEKAKTPIAVAGRVLVYPYQDRDSYQPGDCVCAAPGGTVDIMTREEVIRYPDRIVGTVSCVPNYEEWGGGEGADRDPVKVNGRIWIKVR
jgi:hypothetical protein